MKSRTRGIPAVGSRPESEAFMKKKESLKRLANLKLHRETLLSLETDLRPVRGGDDPAAAALLSVQFCTIGCPPTGGA